MTGRTPSTRCRSPPTGCTRCSPRTSHCALGDRRLLQPVHPAPAAAERLVPGDRRGRGKRTGQRGSADETALAVIVAERDRVSAILDIVRDRPAPARDSDGNRGRAEPPLTWSGSPWSCCTRTPATRHSACGSADALLALLPARRPGPGSGTEIGSPRRCGSSSPWSSPRCTTGSTSSTGLWPVVEAELNLDFTSNVLSRRPPQDYEPFIPESPMGNVLGFQFQPDEGGAERVAALLPVQRRRPRAAPRPAHACRPWTAGRGQTCC